MARPTKYDPAFCDKVIEMGRQGYSVVEMADELEVCRATLEANWTAEHPEFLEAFTRATQAAQAWWERTGRTGMLAKDIDGGIWSRSMSARFPRDWREIKGTELTGKDGGAIKVDAEPAAWTVIDTAPASGA